MRSDPFLTISRPQSRNLHVFCVFAQYALLQIKTARCPQRNLGGSDVRLCVSDGCVFFLHEKLKFGI